MNHNILIHSIAALLAAVPFTHAQDQKAEEKKEARKSENQSSSSSVVTSSDGTATVTIDINGKKETRTFKLGDGNNTFTFGKEGDGAKAGGAVGFAVNPFAKAEHGKREKGPWIGIAMEPVQDVVRAQLPLSPGEGVVIGHVAPESPAAKAGLQENDILVRFEDQIIVEPGQLKKLIAMKKAGDSVKLAYLRKGERKEANVTLIEHEIEPGDGGARRFLQNGSGVFNVPVPGGGFTALGTKWDNRLEHMQEQFKQLKEKHPGVIVDKRAWISGGPDSEMKGQIEKLLRSLDGVNLPKEELEKLQKDLEKVMRDSNEAIEKFRNAVQEAMKARGESRKPHKSEIGEQP